MSNDTAIYLARKADDEAREALNARIDALAKISAERRGHSVEHARTALYRAYRKHGPAAITEAERLAASGAQPPA